MSWLWAVVQAHQRQVGECIDDRIGRCSPIIHALLIGKCDRLTKVFAWSAILQQWSRPQQQHDIGEFAPPLLLVQLGRFRHRSHRHVRKYRGEVKLDGIVPMPIFIDENSLELTYAQYRVISGAYHLRNTPASGHYQVLCEASTLQHQEGGIRVSQSLTLLIMVAAHADATMQSLTIYLVWLMKC